MRGFLGGDEVRDIVQQTCAQICAMEDFRKIEVPRAFLFTAARNISIGLVRHERVLPMELIARLTS